MAERADQIQGPDNVFVWLRDAHRVCPAMEAPELLLYRQAGWSIEQLSLYAQQVTGSDLPFPATSRESIEQLATSAFENGANGLDPSETYLAAPPEKEGDMERKSSVGAWSPCYAWLCEQRLHVFDNRAQCQRYRRMNRAARDASPPNHLYELAQSEAVCRLGREVHLFRFQGKQVRLRAATTDVAAEWVVAVAICGAQHTKQPRLLAQSQLVLHGYPRQLRQHMQQLRDELTVKFRTSVEDVAETKKGELQKLRQTLDETLQRKEAEYRAKEEAYKVGCRCCCCCCCSWCWYWCCVCSLWQVFVLSVLADDRSHCVCVCVCACVHKHCTFAIR